MTKLTQQEAQALIEQAWKDVAKHTLGSFRFGQALQNLIPEDNFKGLYTPDPSRNLDDVIRDLNYLISDADFYYEPNSDIVVEKFYRYFVEGGDDE